MRTAALLFAATFLADAGPAAAGSFFIGGGSASGPATCAAPAPPTISVTALPFRSLIDHTKPVEEITRMGPPDTALLPPGGEGVAVTQGLTIGQFAAPVNYGIYAEEMTDGRWCASLKTVDARFGADKAVTVYVGSQFPTGSCAYAAVLGHENKHVEMYRWTMAQVVPWFDSTLRTGLGGGPTGIGADARAAQADLMARVTPYVDETIRNALAFADQWAATVDTPQEYARVKAECDEWYENLIDRRMLAASRR